MGMFDGIFDAILSGFKSFLKKVIAVVITIAVFIALGYLFSCVISPLVVFSNNAKLYKIQRKLNRLK